MRDQVLLDECRQILAGEMKPLTTREVYARSDAAEGPASVAAALRHLVNAGEAEAIERDGEPRRFTVPRGDDPTQSNSSAQPPERPATSRPRTTPNGTTQIVLGALRADTWQNVREVAERAGLDVQPTRNALTHLGRRGLAESSGRRGDPRGKRWRLAEAAGERHVAAQAAAEQDATQGANEPMQTHETTEAERAGASTGGVIGTAQIDANARYSYRSDGTLVIETAPGVEAVELDRAATERLYRYLTGIHEGVDRALSQIHLEG